MNRFNSFKHVQHFHRQKIREKKRKKKPFHLELFKQVFNITKYFHKLITQHDYTSQT